MNIRAVETERFSFIPALDVHLEYTYLMGKARRLNPYVCARAGAGTILNQSDDYRFVRGRGFCPGGGLALGAIKSLGYRSAFFTEIGFNTQLYAFNIEFSYNNGAPYQRSEVLNHLNLRIGYLF
jgi:hypothetical protein